MQLRTSQRPDTYLASPGRLLAKELSLKVSKIRFQSDRHLRAAAAAVAGSAVVVSAAAVVSAVSATAATPAAATADFTAASGPPVRGFACGRPPGPPAVLGASSPRAEGFPSSEVTNLGTQKGSLAPKREAGKAAATLGHVVAATEQLQRRQWGPVAARSQQQNTKINKNLKASCFIMT